jgi:hypothetical protein
VYVGAEEVVQRWSPEMVIVQRSPSDTLGSPLPANDHLALVAFCHELLDTGVSAAAIVPEIDASGLASLVDQVTPLLSPARRVDGAALQRFAAGLRQIVLAHAVPETVDDVVVMIVEPSPSPRRQST